MTPVARRRLLLALPLGALAVAGGGWAMMLRRMGEGEFDPHSLPSPLIGHQVPDFALPSLAGGAEGGITAAELRAPPRAMLVNFFASWCPPCVQEAAMLDSLAKQGLTIWGIGYKDNAEAIRRFLAAQGNPFQRIALDAPGRVAIDWGVYGVPETYFIDRAGVVRWRYAGALTPDVVTRDLTPLLRAYA